MADQSNLFINGVIAKLYGKISIEDLRIVKDALSREIDGYEIKRKEESLIPYNGGLPESVIAFIATKGQEGKSKKTLNLYLLYLRDFFDTIQKQPGDITKNMIRHYLYDTQARRHISNRSLDSRRSVLSSYFSWSAAEEYIPKNPMVTVRPISYERAERTPLTDTELELVRQACRDIREQALIEVLYSTGCRVTELERLNRADVDFITSEVKLFGKGNKHRKSYLTAKAALLLQQYLETRTDSGEALFINCRKPDLRLKKSGIEDIVRQIGKRAGVDRLHPHLLRHTMSTHALQHGMDVTQLQQLLGHSSLDTTMIYAKVDSSDIQRNHHKYIS